MPPVMTPVVSFFISICYEKFAMNSAAAASAASSSPPSTVSVTSFPHLSQSERSESMLAAFTVFTSVPIVTFAGAKLLTSFTSSPAGLACRPSVADIVTFCVFISSTSMFHKFPRRRPILIIYQGLPRPQVPHLPLQESQGVSRRLLLFR